MREGSRYVFVGGLHRSGTTPLARVLASHPDISGLSATGVSEDEGQHLQDVYPRIRTFGGMGRFANASEAHLSATSPLVSQENADRLVSAWSPYWDLTRRLLVEKTPSNLIMGGFLQALFPGSALIVVVRHPVVVALAMQKWNPLIVARNGRRRTSLAGLVRHWLRAHELLRSDVAHLQRSHVVSYEDLVEDPTRRLAPLQAFLGLDVAFDATGLRRGMNERYQQQWDQMSRGSPIARRIRSSIESRYGDAVGAYGYDIARVGVVDDPAKFVHLFSSPQSNG